MAEIRLQAKSTKTALTVLDTDILYLDSASGGAVAHIAVSELRKKVIGGDITAGTALPSAALIVDADKKIVSIGGLSMLTEYAPAGENDVATKGYIDNTINNNSSPTLVFKNSFTYAILIDEAAHIIVNIKEGSIILGIWVNVTTLFNDSGAENLKLGITATDDLFEATIDPSTTGWKDVNDTPFPYKVTADNVVKITYTGANDDATTGTVEIYVQYARF